MVFLGSSEKLEGLVNRKTRKLVQLSGLGTAANIYVFYFLIAFTVPSVALVMFTVNAFPTEFTL